MEKGLFAPRNTVDINGVAPVILGDVAYPLLPRFKKPVSGHLDTRKELFNYHFSSCRMVVEGAFGHLKGRWRYVWNRLGAAEKSVPKIIAAYCILHNIWESNREMLKNGLEAEM